MDMAAAAEQVINRKVLLTPYIIAREIHRIARTPLVYESRLAGWDEIECRVTYGAGVSLGWMIPIGALAISLDDLTAQYLLRIAKKIKNGEGESGKPAWAGGFSRVDLASAGGRGSAL